MTGKWVLLLVLLLLALCVGEPECSPANQCQDLWTAKKCNVVEYCISEDWSRLKPTGNRDDVCSICLEMVKEARDVLRSNESREQLLQVFEGSCRLLVLKPAVETCDKLVDQLVPVLVEVLSSQMDPETVCSVARLCNNEVFRAAQKNWKECIHCETFHQVTDEIMKSVSPDHFKYGLLQVCSSLGSFSDACSYLSLTHADSLYGIAKSILKKKPCEATLQCPSSPRGAPTVAHSQPMSLARNKMCPLCKTVMSNIRRRVLRVKTTEEFSEKVYEICEELDVDNKTCSQVSGPDFYDKLKSSESLPELFCHVAYCMERPKEDIPVWPLLPVSDRPTDLSDFLEISDFILPQMPEEQGPPPPKPTIAYGDPIENPIFIGPVLSSKLLHAWDGDSECVTCKQVLEILSEPVRNDDDYLNKMFDFVCIGVKNTERCKLFMFKYSPFLRKAFAEGTVSKQMCVDFVPSCQVKRSTAISPESCSLCLNIMNALKYGDSTLWTPSLEEKCIDLWENWPGMCSNLSSTVESLASLLQNSTEYEACSFVKLCEPASLKLEDGNAQSELKKPSCHTCLLTIQSLMDVLKSNESDVVIESVLDSLCDLLPHVEKHMCHNMIRDIGVKEFKKIITSIKPTEVCAELHICKKRYESFVTSASPLSLAWTESAQRKEKVPCKFCMMMMKMLLDQLGDDKTEESIRKALDGLCHYFPEETRDTCQTLIDQYTEDIIDMVVAYFNASEICIFLKVCPNHQLLGQPWNEGNISTYDVETNEVRDWTDYGSHEAYNKENETFIVDNRNREVFNEFHNAVQECALCEALVGVISTHKRMLDKDYDFSANVHTICSIVPRNKFRKCASMLVSYGPSIVNLILDKVDPNEVCVFVDLCDPKMQAKVNQPVSVLEPRVTTEKKNDCLLGPVFWCANAENAKRCGTFLHCQETVWKSWKSPPKRRSHNL